VAHFQKLTHLRPYTSNLVGIRETVN